MDSKSFQKLLNVTELKGMNTNSPSGITDQPVRLLNIHLDRNGGFSPQHQSARIIDGTSAFTKVFYAGVGNHLFLQTASDVQYWTGTSLLSVSGTSGGSMGSALVRLTPGLLLSHTNILADLSSSVRLSRSGQASVIRTPPDVGFWNGSGSPPASSPYWYYESDSSGVFDEATEDVAFEGTVFVLGVDGDGVDNDYSWYKSFTFGKGSANPPSSASPAIVGKYNIKVNLGADAHLYYQPLSGTVLNDDAVYAGATTVTVGSPYTTPTQLLTPSVAYSGFWPFGQVSAFHNNRVWMGMNTTNSALNAFAPLLGGYQVESTPRSRLYYSEVTSANTVPLWAADLYIDPPFKLSETLVGIASSGRYLYIFGDRELLILSGNSDTDFQIESLGDSIGAVATGSIQSLAGTVYWLSDSGLMAVTGGQVQEVGRDIRPELLALSTGSISSTVDFTREIYYITDGTKTYCYHARENAWTERTVGGTLVYCGGIPVEYNSSTLYRLDGKAGYTGTTPGLLDATIEYGVLEFGDWEATKQFRKLSFGVQKSSVSALTITHQSKANTTSVTSTPQVISVTGVTRVSFSMNTSGLTFTPKLTLSGEFLLKPPLQLYGSAPKGEAQ